MSKLCCISANKVVSRQPKRTCQQLGSTTSNMNEAKCNKFFFKKIQQYI